MINFSFSNQMIASPSGPQLTPGGPIRSIGMYFNFNLLCTIVNFLLYNLVFS